MFTDLFEAIFVLVLLCASAWAGRLLHRMLAEPHRSQGPLDFVRLVSGLLVTFTALVLGLLLSQVSSDFKKTDSDLRGYASMLTELNAELAELGAQAMPARQLLRDYTAATIASTWPEEKRPAGNYPEGQGDGWGIDTPNLGQMLRHIETDVRRIVPKDPEADKIQAACLARISAILDQRGGLINEAEASLSSPFFAMMVFWLVIVFASFGLTAPKGPLTIACVAMAAVCLAAAVFTILELDGPLDGLIKVGSEPLRHALWHIDGSLQEAPVQNGFLERH